MFSTLDDIEARALYRSGMQRMIVTTLTILGSVACSFSPSLPASGIVSTRSVDDALASWWPPPQATMAVEGVVDRGSWLQLPGGADSEFRISHGDRSMRVQHHGLLPEAFREGSSVVVRGHFEADGVFLADDVLARAAYR